MNATIAIDISRAQICPAEINGADQTAFI